MKKIIMLLFISLSLLKVKAQTLTNYADTANYLIREIQNKKNLYVGQPMSKLLDSLKLNAVDTYCGGIVGNKDDFGKKLYLEFNNEKVFSKSHFIIVKFDSVPIYEQLFPIFFPSIGVSGNVQSIIAVYRTLIVTDIVVKDYTNDEPVNPGVHY